MSGKVMDAAWQKRRLADLRERVARWDAAPGDGSGYRVTVPLPELRAALAATRPSVASEVERLARLLCDQALRGDPGNRDETLTLLDAALRQDEGWE